MAAILDSVPKPPERPLDNVVFRYPLLIQLLANAAGQPAGYVLCLDPRRLKTFFLLHRAVNAEAAEHSQPYLQPFRILVTEKTADEIKRVRDRPGVFYSGAPLPEWGIPADFTSADGWNPEYWEEANRTTC